ncbi:uncharacterized protein FIBRA_02025 [Fibroporia radiculosa]|uniref:Uncharacterized protein n=1 Tax=Fibroporia radiculosa TaxID=599839 RepID=J4GM56_9APHY|nr:uncharacterized protein FIBRA_02025 [Fibroporia radiculosa]CCM00000.1 predicted protein [Fibroporia radiculosa]
MARSSWARSRTCTVQDTRDALQALLVVLTPTCSLWSPIYLNTTRLAASRHRTILLPLQTLISDVISGTVELRDPSLDLPKLFAGLLRVDDWAIDIYVEWSWWANIIIGYAFPSQVIAFALDEMTITDGDSLYLHQLEGLRLNVWQTFGRSTLKTSSSSQEHSSVLHRSFVPQSCARNSRRTSFSVQPSGIVPQSHVQDIARSLQTSLIPGTSLALEFVTSGPSVSLTSRAFIVAALPFFPRRHARHNTHLVDSSTDVVHAPMPLSPSLPHVLQFLTSGPAPFTICSVDNVSENRVASLSRYVQDLETNAGVRNICVQQWGMDGWREERFFAHWEAAALTAGLLERWTVTVRK